MANARFVPLLSASIFALAGPAHALNCAKADTAAEKAICSDAPLKAQDAALSRFYFDTLRSLKGARHDLMIADQRRWLENDRETNCEPNAKPAALVACLATNLAARRRAIAICFAGQRDGALELAGQPIAGTDVCTFHYRAGCPKVTLTASARLAEYSWILDPLLKAAKDSSDGSGCGAASDAGAETDQDESSTTATILAERPNLLSVRVEDDSMATGAAHPMHGEIITSYDTRTKAAIPVTAVFPALKPGSPLLAKLSKEADKVLDVPCCSDDTDHTFTGIGLPSGTPMPDAWSVAPNGDLVLVYEYNALARDFVATAKIPRGVFIDAVDLKYAGIFVADPRGK